MNEGPALQALRIAELEAENARLKAGFITWGHLTQLLRVASATRSMFASERRAYQEVILELEKRPLAGRRCNDCQGPLLQRRLAGASDRWELKYACVCPSSDRPAMPEAVVSGVDLAVVASVSPTSSVSEEGMRADGWVDVDLKDYERVGGLSVDSEAVIHVRDLQERLAGLALHTAVDAADDRLRARVLELLQQNVEYERQVNAYARGEVLRQLQGGGFWLTLEESERAYVYYFAGPLGAVARPFEWEEGPCRRCSGRGRLVVAMRCFGQDSAECPKCHGTAVDVHRVKVPPESGGA